MYVYMVANMKAHSNEHLLNVIYIVPEHNIVSPFDEKVIFQIDDQIVYI
jgi:hypothetical protein